MPPKSSATKHGKSQARGTLPDRTYTRQEFENLIQRLPWFQALQRTIGEAKANALSSLVFDRQVIQTGGGNQIRLPGSMVADYPGNIDLIFRREVEQIQSKKFYVGYLLGMAREGGLRDKLANSLEPEGNYYTNWNYRPSWQNPDNYPLNIGAARSQRSLVRAYHWICRTWQGSGRNSVLSALTEYVSMRQDLVALGPDTRVLDDIYRKVVLNPPAYRAPNVQTTYPSSIGGRYLLEWIFCQMANFPYPPVGDPLWDDLALFFLGAIVTVQAFTDGNKRVGRIAYAIVLLKGGRPFKAPSVTLENELYHMT